MLIDHDVVAVLRGQAEPGVETAPLFQPFRVSDTGGSGSPAIAYNPVANEYLVVWAAPDPTAGVTRIFGQRLDASGSKLGPELNVNTNTTGAQRSPPWPWVPEANSSSFGRARKATEMDWESPRKPSMRRVDGSARSFS